MEGSFSEVSGVGRDFSLSESQTQCLLSVTENFSQCQITCFIFVFRFSFSLINYSLFYLLLFRLKAWGQDGRPLLGQVQPRNMGPG